MKNLTKLSVLFIIMFVVLFSTSGCSYMMSKNTTTTEEFYDDNGILERVVTKENLTDDASYYKRSAEVLAGEARNTCAPYCAPGELGYIEAFRTIRAITGNSFVIRGMSGVEAGESLGRAVVNNTPLAILGFGLTKAATKPSSVKMVGDGNTYTPVEYHWTGNTGDKSSYSGPSSDIFGIEE